MGESGLARLGWIGVHLTYQRNGIGKTLLENVIEHCRAEGCHKVTLYTFPFFDPGNKPLPKMWVRPGSLFT